MKKKKIIIPFIIAIILIITFIIFVSIKKINEESNIIPDDYIAVFNGGAGEVTYSTYVYKINNNQPNYGFKYINTINTTTYWGSTERTIKITDRGTVDWTDGVFSVAQEHGAYSYVLLPNSDKTYTIDEFMQMFLMN